MADGTRVVICACTCEACRGARELQIVMSRGTRDKRVELVAVMTVEQANEFALQLSNAADQVAASMPN